MNTLKLNKLLSDEEIEKLSDLNLCIMMISNSDVTSITAFNSLEEIQQEIKKII